MWNLRGSRQLRVQHCRIWLLVHFILNLTFSLGHWPYVLSFIIGGVLKLHILSVSVFTQWIWTSCNSTWSIRIRFCLSYFSFSASPVLVPICFFTSERNQVGIMFSLAYCFCWCFAFPRREKSLVQITTMHLFPWHDADSSGMHVSYDPRASPHRSHTRKGSASCWAPLVRAGALVLKSD